MVIFWVQFLYLHQSFKNPILGNVPNPKLDVIYTPELYNKIEKENLIISISFLPLHRSTHFFHFNGKFVNFLLSIVFVSLAVTESCFQTINLRLDGLNLRLFPGILHSLSQFLGLYLFSFIHKQFKNLLKISHLVLCLFVKKYVLLRFFREGLILKGLQKKIAF